MQRERELIFFIYCLLICFNNLLNWWPLIEMICTCPASIQFNDKKTFFFSHKSRINHLNPWTWTEMYVSKKYWRNIQMLFSIQYNTPCGTKVINFQMFKNPIIVIISGCYFYFFPLFCFYPILLQLTELVSQIEHRKSFNIKYKSYVNEIRK